VKVKTTTDYIFIRQPGEPESYAVSVESLDPNEERTIDCGTVTRREGSATLWDIRHTSAEVHTLSDVPKELEAATAEEMQKEYCSRFRVALIKAGAEDPSERVRAYERGLAGLFAIAGDEPMDQMAIFVAMLHAVGDYLADQGPAERDEARLNQTMGIIKARMGIARAKTGFADFIKNFISEKLGEAEGDTPTDTTPTMQ